MRTPDLEPGEHFCLKCRKKTIWVTSGLGQKCYECQKQFPCFFVACGHLDCDAFRKLNGLSKSDPIDAVESDEYDPLAGLQ